MKKYIRDVFVTLYDERKDKKRGDVDTRHRSWEWCRQAFLKERAEYGASNTTDERKKEIEDHLALHLGFFLASWGMYRSRSFLFRCDYTVHVEAVKIILDRRFDPLWDVDYYSISKAKLKEISELIFDKEGIYPLLESHYKSLRNKCLEYTEKQGEREMSETLITKIILGTFGCLPAFDDYFVKGIRYHQGTEPCYKKCDPDTFNYLVSFVRANKDALKRIHGFDNYTPMKMVDMLFWQVGLELGWLEDLTDKRENANKSKLTEEKIEKNKKKAYKNAKKSGFYRSEDIDALGKEIEEHLRLITQ